MTPNRVENYRERKICRSSLFFTFQVTVSTTSSSYLLLLLYLSPTSRMIEWSYMLITSLLLLLHDCETNQVAWCYSPSPAVEEVM